MKEIELVLSDGPQEKNMAFAFMASDNEILVIRQNPD